MGVTMPSTRWPFERYKRLRADVEGATIGWPAA